MKKEKTFHMVGAVLGLAMIVIGVILIFTPAPSYKTVSVDTAVFGSDIQMITVLLANSS